jgi:hypothetical protein
MKGVKKEDIDNFFKYSFPRENNVIPGNINQSLDVFQKKGMTFIPERVSQYFNENENYDQELYNPDEVMEDNMIKKFLINEEITIDDFTFHSLEKLNFKNSSQFEELIIDLIQMLNKYKILILDIKTLKKCQTLEFLNENHFQMIEKMIAKGKLELYRKRNPWVVTQDIYGEEVGNVVLEDFQNYKTRKSRNMTKF